MAKMDRDEPQPGHKPPVIVARYRDLGGAAIAKSVLDSAGIESFLADENIIGIVWQYSNAVGGIKLLVRAEDADMARELLGSDFS